MIISQLPDIMKKTLLLIVCSALTLCLMADNEWLSADTYYTTANLNGKSGTALINALYPVLNSHIDVGYDGLWDVYEDSDTDANGYYIDIYSEGCNLTESKKCGSYQKVCDCVNREHSLPKSWWGGGKKVQYSDAYHLYPTDGKVNNYRSAFALGECANGKTVKQNDSSDDPNNRGRGKLGTSTFSGYSSTVYEPMDDVKGDLARTYFYMVVCYNNVNFTSSNGNSTFTYSNQKAGLTTYGINLLLKWHRQDPVSQREIDRNNAVAEHQHNRNPFIDFPELAEYIWGNKQGQTFNTTTAIEESYVTPEYHIQNRHITSQAQMTVFNIVGACVAQGKELDLPAAGMYLIRFRNNTTVKVIVK